MGGDVVDEDCTCGTTVVRAGNGAEAFSACCVPELLRKKLVRVGEGGVTREKYLEFYSFSP